VVVDPARPEPEHWTEVVPQLEATLQGFDVVGGQLALSYLERAASRLEVRTLEGKLVRAVPLPALGIASLLSGEEDADEAFFSFESFTVPREIFRTSVRTGATSRWFALDVPVDPSRYEITQVMVPSKDGTPVSMFIVHARGVKRDGSSPALLYGYGGFQVAMTPSFKPSIYPWLERGGIWALANLRGGSEYGEVWHQGGMRERKQNTFDDFIAAAEYLVREGWTAPARLAIQGGSNGGLLVGAAMTQRPDLFRVVLCEVPLLDMIRYHRFGSGRTWIDEYGSADDPALFQAIRAYSPYHRVVDGTAYPATLLLSADADDRVDPLHARKFAAALQHASRGWPVLLRIEKNAGHGGADMLRAEVEKIADRYAFALSQMR
jgi:prolyl oligopeptidase